MAGIFAKQIYNSKRWITKREYIFSKNFGICERCGRPGEEVHHKIYLTPENIHDPGIVYGEDNLELLCRDCHFDEHRKTNPLSNNFRKRVRLTNNGMYFDDEGNPQPVKRWLVCGAPASGKTTYVLDHMDHGDLVIDFNQVGQALSLRGKDEVPDNLTETVAGVIDYLYRLIIDGKIDARNIWIVASLPKDKERDLIAGRLNAVIVSIDTDIESCIANIMNDAECNDKELKKEILKNYFRNRKA
ncbi:HNH endonuclease [Acetobacterium woodii]|uniref:Prophage LambdaBa04 n=2 Tax=Acetobacterium woodii (strain ATCC 29683 / DSM 1030 / JCM 2381 / KCTC 1655 / WB1) TaxID=931626 RepID=H6LIU7_ACEWD|nr:HNH endonuclease signature motif containing protein [Acetobacterium woodii]AFA49836.1 prophage LambdaBa04 [Acetobacterium woodii DSM 1030]